MRFRECVWGFSSGLSAKVCLLGILFHAFQCSAGPFSRFLASDLQAGADRGTHVGASGRGAQEKKELHMRRPQEITIAKYGYRLNLGFICCRIQFRIVAYFGLDLVVVASGDCVFISVNRGGCRILGTGWGECDFLELK